MKNIIEEKNAGVGMHIISKQTASGIYMFPVKNGLLQKANQFKSKRPPETEHKVITDDDFQQVQTQIDEIIRNNRLATQSKKPTVFRKRELTLPLAVNGFMMVLTAGILLSIAVAVNKQESDEAQSGEAFSSVEGQLLQRLRQESEYRLSEKDRELEEARKLLAELEYEHGNIVQKQEIQYRDREEEYRRLLAQDVSAERQRLIAAGVPMSELNSILAVYEKERFAYYQDALAKYREQLDEERRVAEENYRRLQKKYQDSIKAISEERQSIQNELREKENAFRIGSEDQSGQPQQNAADAEKTAEARKTLTELEAQRRQNNLEESRITGMFNNLRVALQQSRYQDAVNQSESLIRYLEGSARDTPERQERRNLDRYLADALAQIARNEMYKASDQNPEAVALRGRITALEQENARLARLNSELSQALDAARRREDEIEALTARLSQNERELATLSARITQLEQENARLTRANQELSQGAEQNRRNQAESASLSARITQLEQENARLARANQELSQGAEQNQRNQAESATLSTRITQLEQENARLAKTNQDLSQNVKTQADENRAGIASLTSRLSQLEGENARLTRTNQELTKNQEKATASIDEITAWIAELEAENVKLNYANRELSQKAEKTKNIVDEKQLTSMLQSAHKEGIVNASAILKDALAIKDPGERKRYLENLKPRYSDATGITAFIDLLISRL